MDFLCFNLKIKKKNENYYKIGLSNGIVVEFSCSQSIICVSAVV